MRIVDDDLDRMKRAALIHRRERLRPGFRKHRDSSGQKLCWHHLVALTPSTGRTDCDA